MGRPTEATFSYYAFGLTIASDIDLQGLTPAELAGAPDVRVRAGQVDTSAGGADKVVAVADGVLTASLEGGERLVVDVDPAADPQFAGAVITGELFSALLRQRGRLVLHGSGVARDGVAVGFVGNSGWGKSTLAASLVERGWSLLTDDLLVIDGPFGGGGGRPVAVPSHPSMRLSREAASAITSLRDHRGDVAHERTTKLHVDWTDAFTARPARLAYVFVLDPRLADVSAVLPLSRLEAVGEFVTHTRARRLLTSKRALEDHFHACTRLARAVPAARLQRRFGLGEIGGLCDLVESAVETVPAGSRARRNGPVRSA